MNTEPSAIIGTITAFVAAAIALVTAYGLDMSDAQRDAVLGMTAVLAPLIAALIIRSKVFAPATVDRLANGRAPDDVDATGRHAA